jgi:hypothetical protein
MVGPDELGVLGQDPVSHLSELLEAELLAAPTHAELLRLVADLAGEDVVLAGIAHELGEAADLRQKLEAVKHARRERALVAEAVESHGT